MRLCDELGLNYENSMEYPTFNGMPIIANSIHKENQRVGIVHHVMDHYKKVLTKDEMLLIENRYNDVYSNALKLTIT